MAPPAMNVNVDETRRQNVVAKIDHSAVLRDVTSLAEGDLSNHIAIQKKKGPLDGLEWSQQCRGSDGSGQGKGRRCKCYFIGSVAFDEFRLGGDAPPRRLRKEAEAPNVIIGWKRRRASAAQLSFLHSV